MQPVRDHPRGATAQIKQTSRVAVVMDSSVCVRAISVVVRFDPSGLRVRVRCPRRVNTSPEPIVTSAVPDIYFRATSCLMASDLLSSPSGGVL